jgi:hypothetical protein
MRYETVSLAVHRNCLLKVVFWFSGNQDEHRTREDKLLIKRGRSLEKSKNFRTIARIQNKSFKIKHTIYRKSDRQQCFSTHEFLPQKPASFSKAFISRKTFSSFQNFASNLVLNFHRCILS